MFNRKKRLCRVILLTALTALTAAVIMLAVRDDWRFIAGQLISSLTDSAKVTKISEDELTLTSVDADSLEKTAYTTDQSLLLVNKSHTLDGGFSPDICEYKDTGVIMNSCITQQFSHLSQRIKDEYGETLYISSAYRTAEEQNNILAEQGSDTAMSAGASEHQTGLALDVYTDGFAGKSFLKTDVGRLVNSECWKYGFIIRYPLLKKSVTEIEYEPWHIRYVGMPHAEIISLEHITLEEYFESLEYGKFYTYDGYIISRQQGDTLRIPDGSHTVISSDNDGGCIITVKI